jgi:predicted nucleic acid-binding protein
MKTLRRGKKKYFMIGIDTSALIDLFRGEENIVKLLESIDDNLFTTYINYFEIITGIDIKDGKYNEEFEYFKNLFNDLTLLNLNKKSCEISSLITWELKSKGAIIGKMDIMIAGIFLANGVNKIITRNKKHFENIKGLKVISY